MASRPPAEVRPATREDIVAYLGEVPFTMEATACLVEGRVIAIGGIANILGRSLFFMDLDDEARSYPVLMVKTAKGILDHEAAGRRRRLFAEVDPENDRDVRFLERLGFREHAILDRRMVLMTWQA